MQFIIFNPSHLSLLSKMIILRSEVPATVKTVLLIPENPALASFVNTLKGVNLFDSVIVYKDPLVKANIPLMNNFDINSNNKESMHDCLVNYFQKLFKSNGYVLEECQTAYYGIDMINPFLVPLSEISAEKIFVEAVYNQLASGPPDMGLYHIGVTSKEYAELQLETGLSRAGPTVFKAFVSSKSKYDAEVKDKIEIRDFTYSPSQFSKDYLRKLKELCIPKTINGSILFLNSVAFTRSKINRKFIFSIEWIYRCFLDYYAEDEYGENIYIKIHPHDWNDVSHYIYKGVPIGGIPIEIYSMAGSLAIKKCYSISSTSSIKVSGSTETSISPGIVFFDLFDKMPQIAYLCDLLNTCKISSINSDESIGSLLQNYWTFKQYSFGNSGFNAIIKLRGNQVVLNIIDPTIQTDCTTFKITFTISDTHAPYSTTPIEVCTNNSTLRNIIKSFKYVKRCKYSLLVYCTSFCDNDYETYELAKEYSNTGNPEMRGLLARCYRDGRGVGKDLNIALTLMKDAANHNVVWARYEYFEMLWKMNTPDTDKKMFIYASGLKDKDECIRACLARCYRDGRGVGKDLNIALTLMKDAANHNVVWARYEYFEMLWKMNTPDTDKKMFIYASGLKDKDECIRACLARCYRDGRGVEKDQIVASELMGLASNNGVSFARWEYFNILWSINDAASDNKMFEFATEYSLKGNMVMRALLARCYRDGRGVEKNLDKALSLMKDAMEHNVSWAKYEYFDMLWNKNDPESDKEMFELASRYKDSGDAQMEARLARCYRERGLTDH